MRSSTLFRLRLGDILTGALCLGAICLLNGCGGGGSNGSDTTSTDGIVMSFTKGRLATRTNVTINDLNAAGSQIPIHVLEEYDGGETTPNSVQTDSQGHFKVAVDTSYTVSTDDQTITGYNDDGSPIYTDETDDTDYPITKYKFYIPGRCSSTSVETFSESGATTYGIPAAGASDDLHHVSGLMEEAARVAQQQYPHQPVIVVSDDVDACTNKKGP